MRCATCDELCARCAMRHVHRAAIDPQQSMFFFQMQADAEQGWGAVGGSWQPPVPGLTNPHCQPGPF